MVAQIDVYTLNLPWDERPLNLLADQQQLHFRQHVQISRHTTGEVLWSNHSPGGQLLLLAGKVRLVQASGAAVLEPGKSVLLKPGDWFGDALALRALLVPMSWSHFGDRSFGKPPTRLNYLRCGLSGVGAINRSIPTGRSRHQVIPMCLISTVPPLASPW
jgi:hypothetical protein